MKKLLCIVSLSFALMLAACGSGNATNTGTVAAPTAVINSATSAPTDQSVAPTVAAANSSADASGQSATEKMARAFFEDVNAKQNDTALALVDDHVSFTFANDFGRSKADLAAFLSKNTRTYTISHLGSSAAAEETVGLDLTVSDGMQLSGIVTVKDGKIINITMDR